MGTAGHLTVVSEKGVDFEDEPVETADTVAGSEAVTFAAGSGIVFAVYRKVLASVELVAAGTLVKEGRARLTGAPSVEQELMPLKSREHCL